ncbi:MAG TPA: YfiR family protein [Candidatus Krumholzibacteria bacterium]|nr:YfiR family protein [Candidatus Krumholzibacteria bacterium]
MRLCRRRVRALRALLVLGLLAPGLLVPGPSVAQDAHDEYEVKAAFLFRIGRAFTWPDSVLDENADTLRVGVLGRDPFGGSLRKVFRGKTSSQGLAFRVVEVASLEEARSCQVLFVPSGVDPERRKWLDELGDSGTLLVGEVPEFVHDQGGILALVLQDNRMGMVLNVEELASSGLQASSQFLRLCTIVGDRSR